MAGRTDPGSDPPARKCGAARFPRRDHPVPAQVERHDGGPSYLDEFPDRVGRVTREQANAAIRTHLDPARLSIIVGGDLEKFPE